MLTFQEIILILTHFWAKKGCVVHQGHGVEVGAGTFNPATFLRCLGKEPYNAAYVEPSRRPSDGRFGQNPNRLYLFHQFQVILKPPPSDVQNLYLESLKALKFDLKKHDIRFVHDDWESPTVGAWGLGWEVWCDGMEVTQFTYFQAMGSVPLSPITAEITYGLERLAMFIQNVDNVFDVKWNSTLTLGDIIRMSEQEWSAYNFEAASIPLLKQHFEDFETEAKRLMSQGLPLPAYDFVIKASHTFNLLGARGAISVSQRTGYIGRIRDLSREIASAYVKAREELGYPLFKKEKPVIKKPIPTKSIPFNPNKTEDFLLEIGSEELPASFIPIGMRNLEKMLRAFLEEKGLSMQKLEVFGAPRRLGVVIKGMSQGTHPKSIERRGPPVSSAFTQEGILSPQGTGFFRSLGLKESSLKEIIQGKRKELEIRALKGIDYLFAMIQEEGKSAYLLLQQALPQLIASIEFPKKMHWDDSTLTYARPMRWIVAMLGSQVIPFDVGYIRSHKTSHGHAQLNPVPIAIPSASQFFALLEKHKVMAQVEKRKERIEKQIEKIEAEENMQVMEKGKVLSQVLFLSEWPELMLGSFDLNFLKVPQEVLISEMVEHQKYFPLANKKGRLQNHFLITADNKPQNLIRKGNEWVLSARLSDGCFLYEQDVKIPLVEFNEKLKVMVQSKELGSMFDKVERLQKIAQDVRESLRISSKEKTQRAALLCKADLASALVNEFPELQGTIGKYYACAQKEDKEVASAIEEHWMPKREDAPLPKTETGIVLSLADKIDNLISCYSTGLKPSSSSDPYALRRQAIGLIKILIKEEKVIDLKTLLTSCSAHFSCVSETVVQEILGFITARAQSVFEEKGFKKEEIEACLQGACNNPYDDLAKIEALHLFRKRGQEFAKLLEVYKRAKGQLEKPVTTPFSAGLLKEKAEKELAAALKTVEKEWSTLLHRSDYLKAFKSIATLQSPLAKLFDEVHILCEDKAVSNNRVALLQRVFSLFKELIDFSKIQ